MPENLSTPVPPPSAADWLKSLSTGAAPATILCGMCLWMFQKIVDLNEANQRRMETQLEKFQASIERNNNLTDTVVSKFDQAMKLFERSMNERPQRQ